MTTKSAQRICLRTTANYYYCKYAKLTTSPNWHGGKQKTSPL